MGPAEVRRMAVGSGAEPSSVAVALAVELDAALAADPLVDEIAFLPSASPDDVFGPPSRGGHPPVNPNPQTLNPKPLIPHVKPHTPHLSP
jgi:hypothetical protein